MDTLIEFLTGPYRTAGIGQIVIESIAFICGILSVWYAKKAHVLVYPTGLVGTALTVYLLYQAQYFGDMMMNVYYSLMSLYGWYQWTRYNDDTPKYPMSQTNLKERWVAHRLTPRRFRQLFSVSMWKRALSRDNPVLING